MTRAAKATRTGTLTQPIAKKKPDIEEPGFLGIELRTTGGRCGTDLPMPLGTQCCFYGRVPLGAQLARTRITSAHDLQGRGLAGATFAFVACGVAIAGFCEAAPLSS